MTSTSMTSTRGSLAARWRGRPAARLLASAAAIAAVLAGCGAQHAATTGTAARSDAGIPPALLREARPLGHSPRFHPPVSGPVIGACRPHLKPRQTVHIEVFAANRVVLLPAGLGARRPYQLRDGRIARAACYGDVVTLEPTGVVLVRPHRRLTLGAVFRAWGQPLSRRRLASFRAARGEVRVYVGGRRLFGPPGRVPLTRHAEIVLEVGPFVPPHRRYTFPPYA
jgi:hypothetical protein